MLFDAIISKTENEGEFLLDVDSAVAKVVKKHLSLYKVRRKIAINVLEDHNVHAVFLEGEEEHTGHRLVTRSSEPGSTFCDGGKHASFLPPVIQPDVLCHPDPRLDLLGYRCVPLSKFSNSLICTKQIII